MKTIRRSTAAVFAFVAGLAAMLHDLLTPVEDYTVVPVRIPGPGGGKGKKGFRVIVTLKRFEVLEQFRAKQVRARGKVRIEQVADAFATRNS